jgi:hypothetical protein
MTPRKSKSAGRAEDRKSAFGNEWRRVIGGTDAEVTEAERRLGVTFPDDLKSLLITCGGGRPQNDYYHSRQNNIEVSVGYVLPARDGRVRGIVSECLSYRKTHQLSPTLLPFAYDTGNANPMCLDLASGEVVYWLHDDPSDRVRKVAPTLKEFLSGLKPSPF